ncbi:DUF2076 domain-containing protein [Teichococcus aestuarii]|uniref:ABC transporter substrate-binding protein n=1 Tax=Teichococcus aestuarii TaxID=568898 RepID=A0A2U1V4N0_9PROT|nr:DUF2076 domain-containing protein [Pseudoroseomonas aestuarii]PWC28855.1 hypothetical protein CR165_09630 [Pseudoroseomonas aestuarii]
MTEEERRIISAFVERMAGVSAPQPAPSPWGGSSVPATQSRPPLPPVDPEADRLIADLFARYPEARYRLTQTAFVQEHALVQAQNRIQELEWQLENTQRQAEASQQQGRGGLFGGMFGGGQPRPVPMSPRPQPVQPPQYVPPGAMQQSRGGGFLGSALTTAAGVAGGMVLGNMLMGAFSGGAAEAATAATDAAGSFAQDAVPTSSPWTDPAAQDAVPASDSYGNDAYGDTGGYADDAGAEDGGFDDEI